MKITDTTRRPDVEQGTPLAAQYDSFEQMINEVQEKELPSPIITSINKEIIALNTFLDSDKELLEHLKKTQDSILKMLEPELDLKPKNRYRSLILVLGIGVLAGFTSSVLDFDLGIGITLGMIVGLTIGIRLDNKASKKEMNSEDS